MDKETIDVMLKDIPSWSDRKNVHAKNWFCRAMTNRQYGYDALLDAWTWFLKGWFGGDEESM